MKSDVANLYNAVNMRFAAVFWGCIFLFTAPLTAALEIPLTWKLSQHVEYSCVIEVTVPNERGHGLGYMIRSVLRKHGEVLPSIELYRGKPAKGVYLVMGINNHLNRPYPPEYRWEFYKIVRTQSGKQLIKAVDPKLEEMYVHYDMSLDAFKQLLSKHPFRGKDP